MSNDNASMLYLAKAKTLFRSAEFDEKDESASRWTDAEGESGGSDEL